MYCGIWPFLYVRSMKLANALKRCKTDRERLELLEEIPAVKQGLTKNLFNNLSPSSRLVIASLYAIGQGEVVFQQLEHHTDPKQGLKALLDALELVERSYKPLGGIVGYHENVLQLLEQKGCGLKPCNSLFLHPFGTDISQINKEVNQLIRWGIEFLPQMAEFYPIGGAGERLNLHDDETGEPLPVAQLTFNGRTLLEGLIRDLQAREHLHEKLLGKKVTVPVVLMTSQEKNNRAHIENICRKANWFGRGTENFWFYDQPLVPVITKEGNWSLKAPLVLNMKPGGHGVLWKLADENGIFKKLEDRGIELALVRQINNPIAGLDHGLLAFTGKGAGEKRGFGFASCERHLNTPEGVDVVIETPLDKGFEYTLTNVEYTDFEQRGIEDQPTEAGGTCSAFPSNTNILFANLKEVEKALAKLPFPGMIINMKSKTATLQPDGSLLEIEAGRLETTMQNIADAMGEVLPHEASEEELMRLKTFITYNKRSKTISVAKTAYSKDKGFTGTPEGCFSDLLKEHASLLKQCGFAVGEECLFSYHPRLGPLYGIIAQKIRGGKLEKGAELRIEGSEVDIEGLEVDGSLLIQGKCTLLNVQVKNLGIDRSQDNVYWKNQIQRLEVIEIVVEESGEFWAEGVVFTGNWRIEVPAGARVKAVQRGEEIELVREEISGPTWYWKYSFDEQNGIKLERT